VRPSPALVAAARVAAGLLCGALVVGGLAACSGSGSATGSASPTVRATTSYGTGPNGIEKLTADEILAASKAAAQSASWVHMRGTQSGTTLDLTIGHDTATGTVTQDGLTAQLLAVDGTTYLKGDKAFWDNASGTGSGDALAGKWVVAGDTAGTDTYGLDTFTDVRRVFDSVLAPSGSLTKGGTATVNGVRAVGLQDATAGETLWVALDGPPYPVRIDPSTPTTDPPTFSDWNVPATVTPPPEDQIVDPTKLGG
jgi:hypothetical protein